MATPRKMKISSQAANLFFASFFLCALAALREIIFSGQLQQM